MGNICDQTGIPRSVAKMPKDTRPLNFDIFYCSSWDGAENANYALNLLQYVFPNSKFNVAPKERDGRVSVIANGRQLYDSVSEGYIC